MKQENEEEWTAQDMAVAEALSNVKGVAPERALELVCEVFGDVIDDLERGDELDEDNWEEEEQ